MKIYDEKLKQMIRQLILFDMWEDWVSYDDVKNEIIKYIIDNVGTQLQ